MKKLWYLHWKLRKIIAAVKCGSDPGGHHFIYGICHCGHTSTDDPSTCSCMSIKKLPWMCGLCGKHEVRNLREYGDGLIATCDNCGSEWIS